MIHFDIAEMMDNSHEGFGNSSLKSRQQFRPRSCSNCANLSPRSTTHSSRQQSRAHDPSQQNELSRRSTASPLQHSGQGSYRFNPLTDDAPHLSTERELDSSAGPDCPIHTNSTLFGSQALAPRRNPYSTAQFTNSDVENRDSAFLRQMFPHYGIGSEKTDATRGSTSAFGMAGDKGFSQFEADLREDLFMDAFGESMANPEFLGHAFDFAHNCSENDDSMIEWTLDSSSVRTNDNPLDILSPERLETSSNGAKTPRKTSTHIEPCSGENKTCMTLATDMLKSLLIQPAVCLCNSGNRATTCGNSQPRMSGSVLTGNRDIEMSVCRMLKCTCSRSPQLQLVLVTICDKLLSWYWAVIRGRNDDSASTSVTKRMVNERQQAERVLHQPITIGDHCLDFALASKIRGQVVLGEMKRLEALIEALSRRIKEGQIGTMAVGKRSKPTTFNLGTMPLDDPGLTEDGRCGLTDFLRRQLQAIKTELIVAG